MKQKNITNTETTKQYESEAWIIKIIESCKTPEHVGLCEILIEKYYKLHPIHSDKIHEAFHLVAQKTLYYQHKTVIKKEKLT